METKNRHPSLKWESKHHEFQWRCKSKVTRDGQIKVDFGLNNCTFFCQFLELQEDIKGWTVTEAKRETSLSSWAMVKNAKAGRSSIVSRAHVKKKVRRRGLKTQPEELPVGWEREGEKLIMEDEELSDHITWRLEDSLPSEANKEICTFLL